MQWFLNALLPQAAVGKQSIPQVPSQKTLPFKVFEQNLYVSITEPAMGGTSSVLY